MADKIKCTYDGCFKHFHTVEAMKKHKKKDESHDYYCKKCDMDCTNDTELLYHQITSTRHVACPVCGREFISVAGRDRHVDIEHVPKQSITCVGCGDRFERANALMRHIEKSECTVIKASHFHRQRAEKQISKDAWNAMTDPTAGTTIISGNAGYAPPQPDLTLLDDHRAWVRRDWQGLAEFDPDNEENGPYVGAGLDEQMMRLSMNKYPALGTQSQASPNLASRNLEDSDLLDINQDIDHHNHPKPQAPRKTWSNIGNEVQQPAIQNYPPPKTQLSTNLLDNIDDDQSRATWGTENRPPSFNSTQSIHKRIIPTGTNPNTHIHTTEKIDIPSHINISRFYDPLQENYACPGQRCGQRFPTVDSFSEHLISGVHVSAYVTCPGCLKRFKTTTALISHCESASRKCKVRNALDYDAMIREVTAGMLSADGYLPDGSVRYAATEIRDW